MRYVLVSIIAALMTAAATPASSHTRDRSREAVSIEMVSDSGRTYQAIPHRDFRKQGTHVIKQYLEARKGENYGIIIRNRTPGRIGVVIAVDGRNIISGKKSHLRNSEAMYVVNGYGSGRYNGWRTANDRIHKFYFTDIGDSYAKKTFKDTSAMGVIAVTVYREKERPRPLHRHQNKKSAPAAPAPSTESAGKGAAGRLQDETAGTGFGDKQYSPSIRVAFEPERRPIQKTLVKYEWRKVLCSKGILQCPTVLGNRLWDEGDYAPFPPGYPRNER